MDSTSATVSDRQRKMELVQRLLGLKHKLKVHESMKTPDTHEDTAVMMLTKWEFEDEIRAIEEVLDGLRRNNIDLKKKAIAGGKIKKPKK